MYLTLEDSCSSAPIRVPEDPPCRPYMGGGVGRAQQLSKGSMLGTDLGLVFRRWEAGHMYTGRTEETLSNHLYPRILRRDIFIKTGLAGACSLTSWILECKSCKLMSFWRHCCHSSLCPWAWDPGWLLLVTPESSSDHFTFWEFPFF